MTRWRQPGPWSNGQKAFGLKPKRLTADTAYGTGKLLAWLLDKDITPHIPVWERYERTDGMFSRPDFTYDAERDIYIVRAVVL